LMDSQYISLYYLGASALLVVLIIMRAIAKAGSKKNNPANDEKKRKLTLGKAIYYIYLLAMVYVAYILYQSV